MTERGKVIKAGENITIRFERKTECAKCKMCVFPKDSQHFDLEFKNTLNASEGDIAEVSMPGGSVLLSSAIVYLIPLVMTAAGLLLGLAVSGQTLALILSVVFLALGFIIVTLTDKILKRKNKNITPRLSGIIKQ